MTSNRFRFQHPGVLGTVVDLTVEFADADSGSPSDRSPEPAREAVAAQAAEAFFTEVERLQVVFSAFDPDSELSRWCRRSAPGRDPGGPATVGCSDEFGWLMAEALRWQRKTDGLFNPLVGELSDLWAAAEHDAAGRRPDSEELLVRAEAITEPRFAIVDGCPVPTGDCSRLNLNALAKGYIVDRAIAIAAASLPLEVSLSRDMSLSRDLSLSLDASLSRDPSLSLDASQPPESSSEVTGLLVNAGGDLRRLGSGSARIGIENPHQPFDNAPPLTTIEIGNEAVATSGASRRGFTIGGERYSHVIDPRCGQPAGGSAGATVVAESALTADVLATAAVVLPPSEAVALIDRLAGVDPGSDSGRGALAGLIVGHDRSVHPTLVWLDRYGPPPIQA